MKYQFLAACLVISLCVNQQQVKAQAFENGTNVASVGLGIGSSLGSYAYSSSSPGISLQFEHGQWNVGGPGVISIGGYLGFKSYTYNSAVPDYIYNQKWNHTIIGLRSAYHFNGIDNKLFDVYGGVMLGYDFLSYKYSSSNPSMDYLYKHSYDGGLGLSLFVGGRYFFTDNLAVYSELGYGVAYFTIGAAIKF